ncbi:MAG TPA: trypsin-like peptidase domain-containing protein [Stenomitos sp.]
MTLRIFFLTGPIHSFFILTFTYLILLRPAFAQQHLQQGVSTDIRQNAVKVAPSVKVGPGVALPAPLQSDIKPYPSPQTSLVTNTIVNSEGVSQKAKAVTVLIRNISESGSGILIQHQGQVYTVLTAAHVVKAAPPFNIITPDGQSHDVSSADIKVVPGVDLAIIQFQSNKNYPVATVSSSQALSEGNIVFVAGFPLSTAAITQPVYNITEGKVTAYSNKPFADGYSIVYSNNTLPGMSGGGVFNQNAQLVGIHGRGDVDTKLESSSINSGIRIKTGFNLGIPIETFLRRAKELGLPINITIILSPTKPSNIEDDGVVAAALKAQQGNYNEAIAEISRAIQQSPKSARLFLARANYYAALGQVSAALQDLDQTILLNPNSELAYFMRGNYRSTNRDTVGAISDLSQAIKLNPQNLQAYTLRATLYVGQSDNNAAIADYTNMIRIDPKNALAYNMRAAMYWQQGNQKGAISDMTQLIAFNSADLQAYDNRAHFRKYSGDIPGAIADYTTMLKINPRHLVAYEKRASLKAEVNDISGAIMDYGDMIKESPQNTTGYMERASLYLKLKQFNAAILDYSKLIELQPFQLAWYSMRGSARESAGDKNGASADFKKVAELSLQKGDRAEYESWMERAKAVTK